MRILRDIGACSWGCERGVSEVDRESDEKYLRGKGELTRCGD